MSISMWVTVTNSNIHEESKTFLSLCLDINSKICGNWAREQVNERNKTKLKSVLNRKN